MEYHKIAESFPRRSPDKVDALRIHIASNGYQQHNPIWLYDGKILDGRHRYEICQELGIEPIYATFEGTYYEALVFATQLNVMGKESTKGQLLQLAIEVLLPANLAEGTRRKSLAGKNYGRGIASPKSGKSYEDWNSYIVTASQVGYGRGTIETVKRLFDEAPDLYDDVINDKITPHRGMQELKDRLVVQAWREQAYTQEIEPPIKAENIADDEPIGDPYYQGLEELPDLPPIPDAPAMGGAELNRKLSQVKRQERQWQREYEHAEPERKAEMVQERRGEETAWNDAGELKESIRILNREVANVRQMIAVGKLQDISQSALVLTRLKELRSSIDIAIDRLEEIENATRQ